MRYSQTRITITPQRAYDRAAAFDVYVPQDFEATKLYLNDSIKIPLGLKFEIPPSTCLVFLNKSGVASTKGILVGAQLIDSDYQGEVHLDLHRASSQGLKKWWQRLLQLLGVSKPIEIRPGDKLGQLIHLPYISSSLEQVEENELFTKESTRGSKGFGSSNQCAQNCIS